MWHKFSRDPSAGYRERTFYERNFLLPYLLFIILQI
nr:MAG TPA: hypothetical protein [Caudoviricetes sp.]